MADRSAAGRATLVLVRHGETEGQSSIRYFGRTDLRLSELGRAQMKAVAIELASSRFDFVFASSMVRARESASIIVPESRMTALNELIEIDFGRFEGLTADEIRERHPRDFLEWQSSRFEASYTYPDGESRAAFAARIDAGLKRMLELWSRSSERTVGDALLVAHRGVICAIVRSLAGAEPVAELGSIQILESRLGVWRVRALDIVAHLDVPAP